MQNFSDLTEDEILEMRSEPAEESSLARKVVLIGFAGLLGFGLALGLFAAIVSFELPVPFLR